MNVRNVRPRVECVLPSALVMVTLPLYFGANRFFTPDTKYASQLMFFLQFRIGVVDHQCVETDAGDDEERMPVVGGLIIQKGQTAHIHQMGAVDVATVSAIDIVHGMPILRANRLPVPIGTMPSACPVPDSALRDGTHRAIAADSHHHIGTMVQRFERAGATVLVELRFDEFDLGEMLRLAELLDMLLALFRLGL